MPVHEMKIDRQLRAWPGIGPRVRACRALRDRHGATGSDSRWSPKASRPRLRRPVCVIFGCDIGQGYLLRQTHVPCRIRVLAGGQGASARHCHPRRFQGRRPRRHGEPRHLLMASALSLRPRRRAFRRHSDALSYPRRPILSPPQCAFPADANVRPSRARLPPLPVSFPAKVAYSGSSWARADSTE